MLLLYLPLPFKILRPLDGILKLEPTSLCSGIVTKILVPSI
jgi:hypothetical protein